MKNATQKTTTKKITPDQILEKFLALNMPDIETQAFDTAGNFIVSKKRKTL